MAYNTSYVAKKLAITKDTILYYEKEGLLPTIERDSNGNRIFKDSDIDWIFLIRCLRDTDMPISKVKQYVVLLKNNDTNAILNRKDILLNHLVMLKEKIYLYQNLSKLMEKKISFYDEQLSSDNPETVTCMDYSTQWEHFKTFLGGLN